MTTQSIASSPRGTRTSRTRKTRFVCISDTHNCTVKLPKGDVLIHAGDLTNQGSYSELSKAIQWLEKADFETKIVIAGNHDITLDPPFYTAHSSTFHNQSPQSPIQCLSLLTSSPSITYLAHQSTTIRLSSPTGPRTTFTVFGSPYSPRNQDQGPWAFQYDRDSAAAAALWDAIPLDTDVLVTHTPPYRHCDEAVGRRRAVGCEVLRRAAWRVRPGLHVCGHVHEARGVERVAWDLEGGGNVRYKERGSEGCEDTGTGGRMSLVDLTGRKGRRLENDGGCPVGEVVGRGGLEVGEDGADGGKVEDENGEDGDTEALKGRMGRRETCVVNCAITATNWPHTGGRRFNKPIVVDLDLPVWAWEMEREDGAFGLLGRTE
ncbi:Metallo-dependent phosphatase [Coniochaeta ligniaria NRRL 30616]|uniref:Metallo-dependent phosphatase n=1 Tax=Coniochaeta ligniaria NRRL 30616 TaxID=1408157 RepID=A0A1J7IQ25_9PEZI|nr:Metallo-dependent phosphatase [Coniochaeta ligniaria NRRL 30616]